MENQNRGAQGRCEATRGAHTAGERPGRDANDECLGRGHGNHHGGAPAVWPTQSLLEDSRGVGTFQSPASTRERGGAPTAATAATATTGWCISCSTKTNAVVSVIFISSCVFEPSRSSRLSLLESSAPQLAS